MLKAKDSRRHAPLTVAKPVKPRNWSVGSMVRLRATKEC
jgi:hypothetical protein